MNRTQFAIKYNTAAADVSCEVCGDRVEPNIGPELSLADSAGLVCWRCGRKYAPELVAMLEALRAFDGMGAEPF